MLHKPKSKIIMMNIFQQIKKSEKCNMLHNSIDYQSKSVTSRVTWCNI